MSWHMAVIGIVLAIYIGAVLGVYSICDEEPRLQKVKKYSQYIPAFVIICVIYGIVSSEENRKVILKFLKKPHKLLIMTLVFAEVIESEKEKKSYKAQCKKVIFNRVTSQFWPIFYKRSLFRH